MGTIVKFIYGTEAQILELNPDNPKWVEKAFYYPNDKDYFYQALDGVMKLYGKGTSSGTGIRLNGEIIGGIKRFIENQDVLNIPEYYDYNTYTITVEGQINVNGSINIQ